MGDRRPTWPSAILGDPAAFIWPVCAAFFSHRASAPRVALDGGNRSSGFGQSTRSQAEAPWPLFFICCSERFQLVIQKHVARTQICREVPPRLTRTRIRDHGQTRDGIGRPLRLASRDGFYDHSSGHSIASLPPRTGTGCCVCFFQSESSSGVQNAIERGPTASTTRDRHRTYRASCIGVGRLVGWPPSDASCRVTGSGRPCRRHSGFFGERAPIGSEKWNRRLDQLADFAKPAPE